MDRWRWAMAQKCLMSRACGLSTEAGREHKWYVRQIEQDVQNRFGNYVAD